jgi:hypothetical protein
MSANSPHISFNMSLGSGLSGPAAGVGDSFLYFLGANVTPAAAAVALTIFHSDGATAILTIGSAASQPTVNVLMPSLVPVNGGAIKYTFSGAGATGQMYTQTG